MADSVVMLGGPDHGKRYANMSATHMSFVEFPYQLMAFDPKGIDNPGIPMVETQSRRIVDIKLGAHRARAVCYYPEISPDVAQLMLGDFVYEAFQKYEIKNDRRGRY